MDIFQYLIKLLFSLQEFKMTEYVPGCPIVVVNNMSRGLDI